MSHYSHVQGFNQHIFVFRIVAHKSMIPSVSVNTAGVFRFDEEYGLTINKVRRPDL